MDLGLFGKSNRPSRRGRSDLGLQKKERIHASGGRGVHSDARITRGSHWQRRVLACTVPVVAVKGLPR